MIAPGDGRDSMDIGVDVRPLAWRIRSGIPRVVRSVFRELRLFGSERYIPMDSCPSPLLPVPGCSGARSMSFGSVSPETARSSLGTTHSIDAFLSFYDPVPRIRPCPAVMFVNDLIPVRFEAAFGSPSQTRLFERIRRSAESCERILTISRASKRDIVELWGIPEDTVDVVPLAVDDGFSPDAERREGDDALLRRLKIEPPYVLSVCTIEPRKNLDRLLQAYELIRARGSGPLRLVLTGDIGWRCDGFLRRLAESSCERDIVMTGYLPDSELAALYRNAALFAFPSLYEGFGLPILEAMSCGAPVVTSSVSSMPEVGGDCACYCDPTGVESIAGAMEAVLYDERKRRDMSVRGIERAQGFRWSATAAMVRETLLRLV